MMEQRTYRVPALCSLLLYLPAREYVVMYTTLDSSGCTSYPSLKRLRRIYCDLVKLLAFMSWVHIIFHNIFYFLTTASKVELQKSLKWSYIYLCFESHPYLFYFVRLVHCCQVWIISAEQLFSTVNRKLVSWSGVLDEPYSAKPAQRSSHTGPPRPRGYIGWTRFQPICRLGACTATPLNGVSSL